MSQVHGVAGPEQGLGEAALAVRLWAGGWPREVGGAEHGEGGGGDKYLVLLQKGAHLQAPLPHVVLHGVEGGEVVQVGHARAALDLEGAELRLPGGFQLEAGLLRAGVLFVEEVLPVGEDVEEGLGTQAHPHPPLGVVQLQHVVFYLVTPPQVPAFLILETYYRINWSGAVFMYFSLRIINPIKLEIFFRF
jgi:hypothetical protein